MCTATNIEIFEMTEDSLNKKSDHSIFYNWYGAITSCKADLLGDLVSVSTQFGAYDFVIEEDYNFTEVSFTNWIVDDSNIRLAHVDEHVWVVLNEYSH